MQLAGDSNYEEVKANALLVAFKTYAESEATEANMVGKVSLP